MRRSDIVDAGLALATDIGFETINLRALAGRLDCSPMALYTHIDGKDDLLRAMADRAIATIVLPVEEHPWIDWYVAVALGFWSVMQRFPGLAGYILTSGPILLTPSSVAVTARMFDVLRRAGYEPERAALIWRTAHTYLSGHVMLSHGHIQRGVPSSGDAAPLIIPEILNALEPALDEASLESGLRHILTGFTR